MARFQVRPIADASCARLNEAVLLAETDDMGTAMWFATHNSCQFGAGVRNMETGLVDVGYGWGVLCPVPPGNDDGGTDAA